MTWESRNEEDKHLVGIINSKKQTQTSILDQEIENNEVFPASDTTSLIPKNEPIVDDSLIYCSKCREIVQKVPKRRNGGLFGCCQKKEYDYYWFVFFYLFNYIIY